MTHSKDVSVTITVATKKQSVTKSLTTKWWSPLPLNDIAATIVKAIREIE